MNRRVEKTCSAAKYRSPVFQGSFFPTLNEVSLEAMSRSQKAGILWFAFEAVRSSTLYGQSWRESQFGRLTIKLFRASVGCHILIGLNVGQI